MFNEKKKLIAFLFANFISLLCGLIIVIETNYISKEYLGIFIFQYTAFLLFGNLLTFGQHIYFLNKLSQLKNSLSKQKCLKKNFFCSLVPVFVGFLVLLFTGSLLDNHYLNKLGINKIFLIISCFFFSINKILLNIQNGFNFFYNLSGLIFLRSLFLITAITVILYNKFNFLDNLCFAFLFSELLLFLIYLLYYLFSKIKIKFRLNFYSRNIKDGLKLFGEFFFSDLILKIDILILVFFFNFNQVSIYALTMVFVEGILTILIVFRNFFTSKYGHFIRNKKYKKYLYYQSKYGFIFLLLTIFLIIIGFISLIILNKYFFYVARETYYFYLIICPSLLIYSIFVNAEYIFSLNNNFYNQTKYFIKAIFFQIIILFLLFKNLSIYSFPIAISLMFIFMSINLYYEIKKIR